MKVPKVVDLHALQQITDVLRKADLHKLQAEIVTCLPSLPNMPDLHKLREELKTSIPLMDLIPSLSSWHGMEHLYSCLPELSSAGNHIDPHVMVCFISLISFLINLNSLPNFGSNDGWLPSNHYFSLPSNPLVDLWIFIDFILFLCKKNSFLVIFSVNL